MNYNNQYEHLNLSLFFLFMLSYTCYCTKLSLAYKFYEGN